jgi:hypothetical protein
VDLKVLVGMEVERVIIKDRWDIPGFREIFFPTFIRNTTNLGDNGRNAELL